jgi:hypothetical protein
LLGFGSDADAETVMSELDDLQRLSKIMASHGEEHGLKIGGPTQVRPACHSQGYWLFGRPHDANAPGVADNRRPFACDGHDALSSS